MKAVISRARFDIWGRFWLGAVILFLALPGLQQVGADMEYHHAPVMVTYDADNVRLEKDGTRLCWDLEVNKLRDRPIREITAVVVGPNQVRTPVAPFWAQGERPLKLGAGAPPGYVMQRICVGLAPWHQTADHLEVQVTVDYEGYRGWWAVPHPWRAVEWDRPR